MPLYSYTPELAPLVKSGAKSQTIRTKRKIRPRVGQLAHNYAGGYSTKRQHLGSPVITEVHDILVGFRGIWIDKETIISEQPDLEVFAKADGFDSWPKMQRYFMENGGLPFEGDLIKWDPA